MSIEEIKAKIAVLDGSNKLKLTQCYSDLAAHYDHSAYQLECFQKIVEINDGKYGLELLAVSYDEEDINHNTYAIKSVGRNEAAKMYINYYTKSLKFGNLNMLYNVVGGVYKIGIGDFSISSLRHSCLLTYLPEVEKTVSDGTGESKDDLIFYYNKMAHAHQSGKFDECDGIVEQDTKKAIEYFEKANRLGCIESYYHLGQISNDIEIYKVGANLGSWKCCFKMYVMLREQKKSLESFKYLDDVVDKFQNIKKSRDDLSLWNELKSNVLPIYSTGYIDGFKCCEPSLKKIILLNVLDEGINFKWFAQIFDCVVKSTTSTASVKDLIRELFYDGMLKYLIKSLIMMFSEVDDIDYYLQFTKFLSNVELAIDELKDIKCWILGKCRLDPGILGIVCDYLPWYPKCKLDAHRLERVKFFKSENILEERASYWKRKYYDAIDDYNPSVSKKHRFSIQ